MNLKVMGKVVSKITRPIKMINIDNRAEKIITRSKPVPAPMYESTRKQLEVARKINPTFMEEHYKKDPQLDDNLKSVYITSEDPQISLKHEESADKLLPKDRHIPENFEYGFWEPATVPPGKVTLRTVIQILGLHAEQPRIYNKTRLAKQFNLDSTIIEKIINNYGIMTMEESEESTRKRKEEERTMIEKAKDYAKNMTKQITDESV